MAFNIQGAYIADGFADDCDELMERCRQAGTLNYEIFCDIWKEMGLARVFHGRTSGAELAELSEELIYVAKQYMVANTGNFEESVAGLFLVYGLLNLQPYPNFASLRLLHEDIPALERMELVARRERRQDVLYILGSVLIKGPVQYQAAERERGMEHPIRKYLEGDAAIGKLGIRPKGVFYRQNTELDLVKDIKNLTVRYTTAKENIAGIPPDDRNLNYFDPNFATEQEKSLKDLVSGKINEPSNDNDSNASCDHIKNLKKKAMMAPVKPIRHLIGVENTSKNPCKPEASSSKTNINRPQKRARTSTSDEESDVTTTDELQSDEEINMTNFDKPETEDEMSPDQEFEDLEAIRGGSENDDLRQPSTSGTTLPGAKDLRKRDSKKTILKSRFKRMGMLPVANFESK